MRYKFQLPYASLIETDWPEPDVELAAAIT